MNDKDFFISNGMDWGNKGLTFRYNKIFSNKLITNLSVGSSQYAYDMNASLEQYGIDLSSAIRDYYANLDFKHLMSGNFNIEYGVQFINHKVIPNKVTLNVHNVNFKNTNEYLSYEYAAYTQGNLQIDKNFSLSGGLRFTRYEHIGPYIKYIQNNIGQIDDSINYKKNESVAVYNKLSPNISFIKVLNDASSIKGSCSLTHQFIHLASVGTVSLPSDLWLPSTDYIKPQNVGLASVGYFRNFSNNTLESSCEVFYKKMNNQIDFLYGILDNFDNTKIEQNIIQGTGGAIGAEFYIKKQLGNTTGWAAYTLSKTWRKFSEINNGKPFPAKYDRVHDISLTINHKFNEKWDVSAVFIYATGNAMTLPTGRYFIQGNLGNDYSDVNSFRMPAYHRLDISANYKLKDRGRFKSNLNFSVYNVYNRNNPYFIYFQAEGNVDDYYLSVKPQQISLFPILPTFTWNFKF